MIAATDTIIFSIGKKNMQVVADNFSDKKKNDTCSCKVDKSPWTKNKDQ